MGVFLYGVFFGTHTARATCEYFKQALRDILVQKWHNYNDLKAVWQDKWILLECYIDEILRGSVLSLIGCYIDSE